MGPMIATDATATAALEAQLRQLTAVLERLVNARAELVPAKATFWRGDAREAYDRAVREVEAEIGSALDLVRYAQQNTVLALAAELARA